MTYLSKDKDTTSFKGLFAYTDMLKERIIENRVEGRVDEHSLHLESDLRQSLLDYYECLKMSNRLRSQTNYCKQTLEELFPAFCKGYFSKRKSK